MVPIIFDISDHRHAMIQSQYIKGTRGHKIRLELAIQTPGCSLKAMDDTGAVMTPFGDVVARGNDNN